MRPWLCLAFLLDCAKKLPGRHHFDSKLVGADDVFNIEGNEAARLRGNCRFQHVRIFGVLNVPPPQVVGLSAPGLPVAEQQITSVFGLASEQIDRSPIPCRAESFCTERVEWVLGSSLEPDWGLETVP